MITKQTVMTIKAAKVKDRLEIIVLLDALKKLKARRPDVHHKSHLSRNSIFNFHKDVCRFDLYQLLQQQQHEAVLGS